MEQKTKRYALEDNPKFNYGDIVEVDFSCFGGPYKDVIKGTIVGVGSYYIITHWLVDFGFKLSDVYPNGFGSYPYSTLSVQHTFICKKN